MITIMRAIYVITAFLLLHSSECQMPWPRYARGSWKGLSSLESPQQNRRSKVLGATTIRLETTVGPGTSPEVQSGRDASTLSTTPKTRPPTNRPSSASPTAYTKITTLSNKITPAQQTTTKKYTISTTRLTPIATQKPSTKRLPAPKTTTPKTVSRTTHKLTSASIQEVTTPRAHDVTGLESSRINSYYHQHLREKPKVKIAANISQNLVPLPAGASAALVKPTKYHYYPHNQHIYLLPECAIQQVCNAVYVRLNFTQPLCACPSRYRDPCSASLNSDDLHTTELITDPNGRRALTLVKTCEPTTEMRECRAPRDWSLLALQNIRTGKSHYLVICRCPDTNILEGPMSHDQPTYASVPGIRVYGMMCVQLAHYKRNRVSRPLRYTRALADLGPRPPFPWEKVQELHDTAIWD